MQEKKSFINWANTTLLFLVLIVFMAVIAGGMSIHYLQLEYIRRSDNAIHDRQRMLHLDSLRDIKIDAILKAQINIQTIQFDSLTHKK